MNVIKSWTSTFPLFVPCPIFVLLHIPVCLNNMGIIALEPRFLHMSSSRASESLQILSSNLWTWLLERIWRLSDALLLDITFEHKRPLGRPRRRWVDNIRMDLQEVGGGHVDWIGLAQDRDRWRTLVSAVMNLRVPWNAGILLTSCKPVSCSGRTLHHGVSK